MILNIFNRTCYIILLMFCITITSCKGNRIGSTNINNSEKIVLSPNNILNTAVMTVQNTSQSQNLIITRIQTNNTNVSILDTNNTCINQTVQPNGICNFTISANLISASANVEVTLIDNNNYVHNFNISANAVQLSADNIDGSGIVSYHNASNVARTISAITSDTPDVISISNNSCTNNSIPPNSSCSFNISTNNVHTSFAAVVTVQDNYNTINFPITINPPRPNLSPSNILNGQTMTFQNNSYNPKTITAITTNNTNVILSSNGDFCSKSTIITAGTCNFVLFASNLPTATPVAVTITYNDGTSDTFDTIAQSSNTARFSTANARYVLMRYIWLVADFDIGAGFTAINPTPIPNPDNFPIFTPILNNCVGYFCRNSIINYNGNTLISWAGDNTTGGEEDTLIDLWQLPNNTNNFNYGLWGAWYSTMAPTNHNITLVFETYSNGTHFTQGGNHNFIPDQNYLEYSSAVTNFTFASRSTVASLSVDSGLICNYISPVISGQANTANCVFNGII